MGSGRLPGKVMKDLCGHPMIYHVIERCRKSDFSDDVILATTNNAQDGVLAEFFEDEVGNATGSLASIIEPILMLIIGSLVGFFAISMVQPMYSMLESIQ